MEGLLASELRTALASTGAASGEVVAGTDEAAAASWGRMPAGAVVEAGSVTKGVTGLLLALGHAAGEVSPDDRLGRFLDVGQANEVTLASLATHTSGLPRLPSDFAWQLVRHRKNPYTAYDVKRLLWATQRTRVAGAGAFSYSNLGVALLGHALARAAGAEYWALATERVLRPLGMLASGDIPDSGTWSSGRLWNLQAFGPAGGLRAPVSDLYALADLAAAPEDTPLGEAAADALRPRLETPNGRIGWCWMTTATPDGDVRWHNGGTGAAWTMVAGSPRAAAAASVASSPSPAYDQAVLRVLTDPASGRPYGSPP